MPDESTTQTSLDLILRQHEKMVDHLIARVEGHDQERRDGEQREHDARKAAMEANIAADAADAASRKENLSMIMMLAPKFLEMYTALVTPSRGMGLCADCAAKAAVPPMPYAGSPQYAPGHPVESWTNFDSTRLSSEEYLVFTELMNKGSRAPEAPATDNVVPIRPDAPPPAPAPRPA